MSNEIRSHLTPKEVRSQLRKAKKDRIKEIIGHCEICWGRIDEIHHITSVSEGGTNDVDNLIGLCSNHHTDVEKNKFTQEELRSQIREERDENQRKRIQAVVEGNEEPKGFLEEIFEGIRELFK